MNILIIRTAIRCLVTAAVTVLFCSGETKGQMFDSPSRSLAAENHIPDAATVLGKERNAGGDHTSRKLKSSKSSKSSSASSSDDSSGASMGSSSIEGTYLYAGCNERVFQATIMCDVFGSRDPDLCIYQEYALGQNTDEDGENAIEYEGNPGVFFHPNEEVYEEGVTPSDVCVFSGTFRYSAARQGKKILPIPLATSEGCQNVNDNFLYVAKMKVRKDGDLKISFSRDGGESYYTDDVDCPKAYTAQMVEEDDDRRRLQQQHGRRLFLNLIPVAIRGIRIGLNVGGLVCGLVDC